jgi:small ligand-binding sensory domain FIST
MNNIKWANALSTRPSLEAAITEVVERAIADLQAPPDFGLVFIAAAYASEYLRLMPLLREKLTDLRVLIGCGGGGIIGMDRYGEAQEIEGEPAISLTLISAPEVKFHPFYISGDELPDLDSPPDTWIKLIGVDPQDNPQFILLSDPFSFNTNDLLQGLDFAYPGAVKVGGLASTSPFGGSGLFFNDRMLRQGTVGVALTGNIILETIVAQGCRPIGKIYQITNSDRNIITELTNQDTNQTGSPLELLQDLIQGLSDEDRFLAQNSLFVGIARDGFKQFLGHGDFLIRNLLGVEPRSGAIAIADRVRTGQRIQFHLRDADASAEDLELMLDRYTQTDHINASGALMFSCLGRGEGLYAEANFDSRLFARYLKNIPVGGFFCNGEIGPVGGATFLHGYTSVFGIFSS